MKNTIKAWLVFFGGFAVEISVHYWIRVNTNLEIREYEVYWFAVQWVLTLIAVSLLVKAGNSVFPFAKRLGYIGINITLGFVLYNVIGLWYVIGTGLDAM